MEFDPIKDISLFIPKDLTLVQSIKGDLKLQKRTRYYTKMYKRTFPNMKRRTRVEKGRKMAYTEYIILQSRDILD